MIPETNEYRKKIPKLATGNPVCTVGSAWFDGGTKAGTALVVDEFGT